MSHDLFSTYAMGGVIRTLRPTVPGFWLNFFTREFLFDTEEVDFDIVTVDRKIAPFVMPTVAGKPQRERGFVVNKHKPAYIKVKNNLNPRRTLERQPGEQFGGSLSPAAREAALLAAYLADHRDQVERRWNWMAAQAMLNGSITLSGDEYPTTTVDFGRAAGQTITLGSGSRWGESGIVALDNLETWSTTVFNAVGYPVDVVIMGTTAWTAFRKDTNVQALMDLRRGTDRLGGLDIVPGSGAPLQYKGTDGQRQYYVYAEAYDTDESTTVNMMDPRDVLLVATAAIAGARCYGAILDMESLQAQSMFVKSWTIPEPSARVVLTQSAPMMVMGRVNACLKARVVA